MERDVISRSQCDECGRVRFVGWGGKSCNALPCGCQRVAQAVSSRLTAKSKPSNLHFTATHCTMG